MDPAIEEVYDLRIREREGSENHWILRLPDQRIKHVLDHKIRQWPDPRIKETEEGADRRMQDVDHRIHNSDHSSHNNLDPSIRE